MTKKIFNSMLSISVAVTLMCVLGISYVLYGHFGNIIKDELKSEASLISYGIMQGDDYLENINSIEDRITLVDTDGTVLFDSRADAAKMENHGNREEIAGAREHGEVLVTRYSDTLSTKTIYYAKLLPDGKILRMAQEQSMVMFLLKGVVLPVSVILLILLLVSMIISRFIAGKIITPINEIDLDCRNVIEPYPELAPLTTKIRQQNSRIKQQMADLEREQKEFKAITENMSEGFLLIDKNMDILSYNTAALNLLGEGDGYTPHTAFELNRSKSFRDAVEESLDGRHNQQLMEMESKCYSIMANPVTEDGKIVGAVLIIVDATEKEQRDRLRREFTSNVSHELKTPLTTIYGVSDMMAEGIIKSADVKDFGKTIKDESGRMISLIDDIIKLSKLDEEYAPDEKVPVDLFDISKHVIDRLKDIADNKNVSLYLEGETAVISGLPSLCDEIIYNLCENAIKYNKENGSVTINVKSQQEEVVLSVEDTGIGIPHKYRDRIFERFFRVDKSHSQKINGTGLGLSIVKHAVLHLGGSIEVESHENIGTKMIVRFPECVDSAKVIDNILPGQN